METVLQYYNFTAFTQDVSKVFSGNQICFTALNETHFLVFELENEQYTLYISKYKNKQEIGVKAPEILETLVKNYDKSVPEHRIILRRYVE